jgi:hypothetical protein
MTTTMPARVADGVTAAYLRDITRRSAAPTGPEARRAGRRSRNDATTRSIARGLPCASARPSTISSRRELRAALADVGRSRVPAEPAATRWTPPAGRSRFGASGPATAP